MKKSIEIQNINKSFKYFKALDNLSLNERVINRSISGLANKLNKKVANEIEARNEERNQFIRTLFFLNPIIFFQNRINQLAETDYYSYKNFRKEI